MSGASVAVGDGCDTWLPQNAQRGLTAATKTTDCLNPQITQIGRFHWEPQNLFGKTMFCAFVV